MGIKDQLADLSRPIWSCFDFLRLQAVEPKLWHNKNKSYKKPDLQKDGRDVMPDSLVGWQRSMAESSSGSSQFISNLDKSQDQDSSENLNPLVMAVSVKG